MLNCHVSCSVIQAILVTYNVAFLTFKMQTEFNTLQLLVRLAEK